MQINFLKNEQKLVLCTFWQEFPCLERSVDGPAWPREGLQWLAGDRRHPTGTQWRWGVICRTCFTDFTHLEYKTYGVANTKIEQLHITKVCWKSSYYYLSKKYIRKCIYSSNFRSSQINTQVYIGLFFSNHSILKPQVSNIYRFPLLWPRPRRCHQTRRLLCQLRYSVCFLRGECGQNGLASFGKQHMADAVLWYRRVS